MRLAAIESPTGALAAHVEADSIARRPISRVPLCVNINPKAVHSWSSRSIAGPPLRFPYGPSPWLHPSRAELAATGWLWSGAHKGSVPMLGAGGETPNVLLIFEEPIIAPRLRREAAGLPREGDELPALALCVEDPIAPRRPSPAGTSPEASSEEEDDPPERQACPR